MLNTTGLQYAHLLNYSKTRGHSTHLLQQTLTLCNTWTAGLNLGIWGEVWTTLPNWLNGLFQEQRISLVFPWETMFCDTFLNRSCEVDWPTAGYRKPTPMEQDFRRAHQMLLAIICQLCCTWTTSLNSIRQPCSCKQGRHPGWDLSNWDSYCFYLQ